MFSFLGRMLVIQHINLFYYKEQKVQGAEQATIFDAYNTEWKPDMEVIPQCNIYSGTYRRHLRCYTANWIFTCTSSVLPECCWRLKILSINLQKYFTPLRFKFYLPTYVLWFLLSGFPLWTLKFKASTIWRSEFKLSTTHLGDHKHCLPRWQCFSGKSSSSPTVVFHITDELGFKLYWRAALTKQALVHQGYSLWMLSGTWYVEWFSWTVS